MLEQIRKLIATYPAREVPLEGRAQAAVLIPIYTHEGRLHVVLTKRTDRVEHHKGEISFPGGARDPDDLDLVATALRESEEEIGLLRDHVEVLGRIDEMVTMSQFHVTPYVGVLDPAVSPYPWKPFAVEVAEVLEVPLDHLLDPANLVLEDRMMGGRRGMAEAFQFGDHRIWGATARMLRNFLDVTSNGQDRL